jgi:hypothetical protein
MKRLVALAVLVAIATLVSTGCPRRVLVPKVVDTPIESVAK